jgi:hypothetical protein
LKFLASKGVDTSGAVEAWIIRKERRRERLTMAQLADATFEANPAAKGEILIGAEHLAANAIAFHTRPLSESDLPVVLPNEEL